MIIECSHCHARYQYDEERFERKRSKKIRCARCREVFEAENPAFQPRVAPAIDPAEQTYTGRRRTMEELLPDPDGDGDAEPEPDHSAAPLRLPARRRLSLAIIGGPDSGKVFRLDKPEVVIGRAGADIALNDIETSRGHARIEVRDDVVLLRDMGSTNGTLQNGEKIDSPVILQNHSEFQIGTSTLMLIITDAAD